MKVTNHSSNFRQPQISEIEFYY